MTARRILDQQYFGPRAWYRDVAAMISLITVLPSRALVPQHRSLRAMPIAGAVASILSACLFALSLNIGLPVTISATLSIACLVMTGGGLHEDGLADTADGFGGGGTQTEKLEIMRDSVIGSFGTIAIVLSLLARILLLVEIARLIAPITCMAVLIAVGALSRTGIIAVLASLPSARPDGLGAAYARPSHSVLIQAFSVGGILSLALLATPGGMSVLLAAWIGMGLATFSIARLAMRQIGGQTGDVCGAVQQGSEIFILIFILAAT
jgi:adenosylcobinamide-GDP ribazoletransferase